MIESTFWQSKAHGLDQGLWDNIIKSRRNNYNIYCYNTKNGHSIHLLEIKLFDKRYMQYNYPYLPIKKLGLTEHD